ncbi:hypothetical protein BcepSauron_199 [Burkholderia phage BcepSauron]|uniref:Uncharacterized protein n=1 Tax=Burkholderia phage BcepSauron TaxID=2530033 RepID=A0A482MLP2_9CAUD|nr:hypothetical protein H1O17_gp199 [Burkholderia phage BcepSauron]QBQ74579.1 hypothetical protein BcepSauron_199 [Burkholderia phage BcepSauron]
MAEINNDRYMIYQDSDTDYWLAYIKLGPDPGITVNVTHVPEPNRETFVKLLRDQIIRAAESAFKRGSYDAKLGVRMALRLD